MKNDFQKVVLDYLDTHANNQGMVFVLLFVETNPEGGGRIQLTLYMRWN